MLQPKRTKFRKRHKGRNDGLTQAVYGAFLHGAANPEELRTAVDAIASAHPGRYRIRT